MSTLLLFKDEMIKDELSKLLEFDKEYLSKESYAELTKKIFFNSKEVIGVLDNSMIAAVDADEGYIEVITGNSYLKFEDRKLSTSGRYSYIGENQKILSMVNSDAVTKKFITSYLHSLILQELLRENNYDLVSIWTK